MSSNFMGNTDEGPVLLWKHTNPSLGFKAQTLNLDGLSNYRFVIIHTSYYNDSNMITANFLDKSMSIIFGHGPCTSLRDVSFDGNKLNVGIGKYYNVYANGNVMESDFFCVPMKIYGIK